MKSCVIIFLAAGILLLLSVNIPAQWISQESNMPANVTAYRVCIVNEKVVWAGGQKPNLNPSPDFTRTVDGGEHWIAGSIPLPSDFFILNISASSADTAWAAVGAFTGSNKAGVYKTTDGGKTWQQQFIASPFPSFVYFFNSREGLVFCDPISTTHNYHAIYTTSDGGTKWEPIPDTQNIPLFNGEGVSHSLYSVSGNDFYTASSAGRIMKSRDKGKSWSVNATNFASFVWPAFKDSLNGLLAATTMSNHYGMAKTLDGGITWPHVSSPYFLAYFPASIPETSGGYVVSGPAWGLGRSGSALTMDNGTNWIMIDDVTHLWTEFFSYDLGWGGDGNSNKIYKWSIGKQPAIGCYPLTALTYGSVRTGLSSDPQSIYITNYGKEALVISEIIKPGINYQLVNPLALPLTLESLHSTKLEVCFNPQETGLLVDSLVIISNAANSSRLGIKFEGTGIQISRVLPDVLYAVSQTSLYTLDPSTGKATLVGPLGITQVQGLAINPVTLVLIGASTSASTMTYYQIDPQTANTVLLRKITINNSRATTFKADTLYAASMVGMLSRIDLNTGTVTSIGTAPSIGYFSLSVHPNTGQLYASARSTTGTDRDRIFTINSINGDTTLIGSTGDNALTPAIAFAPSGKLYGLKGTGSAVNTLISIDSKTGVATLVGSTGVSGLQALAIGPSTTVVQEQVNEYVRPDHFVLLQNYPNPFNPTTTIEFSLLQSEQVSLKIYSLLGKEVAHLLNEKRSTGTYKVDWNASNLASGVYFYVFRAGNYREVRKAVLMK